MKFLLIMVYVIGAARFFFLMCKIQIEKSTVPDEQEFSTRDFPIACSAKEIRIPIAFGLS